MEKVGIVLVNYNGEKFQNACIDSLKKQSYQNYEIIVVDNYSQDHSIPLLKEVHPDVSLIELAENTGVAKGNNIGIEYALNNGCEYVLLLNNDTEVDEKMLEILIEQANEKTLVTCKMYYYSPNNRIWCAGGKINWNKATTTNFGEGEEDKGQYDEGKYIDWTPTCALLIHKAVFKEVGLMDEKYFIYYDDTDFCVRVLQKGYKIWYEPNAKLWHKVSSSSGGKQSLIGQYFGDRNRLYFIEKFYKNKIQLRTVYYFTRIVRIIQFLAKGDKTRVKTIFESIRDYYRGDMGPKPKRSL